METIFKFCKFLSNNAKTVFSGMPTIPNPPIPTVSPFFISAKAYNPYYSLGFAPYFMWVWKEFRMTTKESIKRLVDVFRISPKRIIH